MNAAVSVVALMLSGPEGPLNISDYDPFIDAAPTSLSMSFQSEKEGIRLGYGSELEAEACMTKMQAYYNTIDKSKVTMHIRRELGQGARSSWTSLAQCTPPAMPPPPIV